MQPIIWKPRNWSRGTTLLSRINSNWSCVEEEKQTEVNQYTILKTLLERENQALVNLLLSSFPTAIPFFEFFVWDQADKCAISSIMNSKSVIILPPILIMRQQQEALALQWVQRDTKFLQFLLFQPMIWHLLLSMILCHCDKYRLCWHFDITHNWNKANTLPLFHVINLQTISNYTILYTQINKQQHPEKFNTNN